MDYGGAHRQRPRPLHSAWHHALENQRKALLSRRMVIPPIAVLVRALNSEGYSVGAVLGFVDFSPADEIQTLNG